MSHPSISYGLPPDIKRFKARGLLFIGDPQMSCVAPGRRVEEDFLAVTLDKLTQCRKIAEAQDLFPVFLGDMVENPTARKAGTNRVVEDTNRILSGFARAMGFRPSVTLPGNHDKAQVRLTEGTTLAAMRDLQLIHVIEPSGPFAIIEIDDCKVGLGGTPYGEDIPHDVRGVFGEAVDKVVWITHDLFRFDLTNTFLQEVFPIQGCDIVVNGHDHTTKKPLAAGDTQWFNPGNITRLSIDTMDHVPSCWQWHPTMPAGHLQQHILQYNKAAFKLEGLQVSADSKAATAGEAARGKSLFADLLRRDAEGSASEMDRSATGDLLAEDIKLVLEDSPKISDGAKLKIHNLHMRAPERLKT